MDNRSQNTLRKIEQNDAQFTELQIGNNHDFYSGSRFKSSNACDYSRLGAAIGNNTHLTKLIVALDDEDLLDVANEAFFDGLRHNSSIDEVLLDCDNHILVGGIEHEILKSYQKNNSNLSLLDIDHAVLDNGGGDVITETLRWCRNLKIINFGYNSRSDEQLLPMIEAIKGRCNTSLEHLYLDGNRIGNIGCEALATLLADPNTKLQYLSVFNNNINNEGATAIADSLANNTTLKKLDLNENPFDSSVVGIFCRALCNTSSVNDTYRSNHTLDTLVLSDEQQGQHADRLATLLKLNEEKNKNHVAIRKILKYHPNIDMEPLFEWDAEGEQSSKALPYVIDWFERARAAVAGGAKYDFEEKKLTAIFQFSKSMPLLFVPATHGNGNEKKRKSEVVVNA